MFGFLQKRTKEERELIRNSSKISKGLISIFNSKKIDDESLDELEELLVSSDMNIHIVGNLIDFIRNNKCQ
jgi:fused signal recognition particle receptor